MARSWGTSPIAALPSTEFGEIGMPTTTTSPASRSRRPANIEIEVVFPAPSGPRRPKVSPSSIEKPTPPTAVRSPNRRTRPVADRTFAKIPALVAQRSTLPILITTGGSWKRGRGARPRVYGSAVGSLFPMGEYVSVAAGPIHRVDLGGRGALFVLVHGWGRLQP